MDHVDRLNSWLMFGIGVLHCGVTFFLFSGYSEGAMWFFSAGLAMVYCAALNLLRIRYAAAAAGVRRVSLAVNLSLLVFVLVYVAEAGLKTFRNPAAVLLVLCAVAATTFSARRVFLTLPRAAA